MPTFKLDGQEIPFEKGETIIRAANRAGVHVPHYCWHPGLSVAANCRMCLVEIEPAAGQRAMMLDVLKWDAEKKDYVVDRKPKLTPACQMAAGDGMVVKSESSPHVALARKNVQEFLLLNHPVDCPICDQAGECMLQDYYMSQQRTPKRMRDEPVHKPKGVTFGPTIVYDAERCIACTRCVRFCEEVTGDPVLELTQRGNLFEIVVAPGRQLDGKYTMMVEHVCPVGALTTKYWRHKGRVWLLKSTPSVCPGCATGCNMWFDADPREQTAFRNRPRENADVNRFWMCDDGMLTYQRVQKDRVTAATVGRGKDAKETPLEDAIRRAATDLAKAGSGKLAVVLSAQHSTEDNLVAAEFAAAAGAKLYLSARGDWEGDKILRHSDQNPNRAGVMRVAGVDRLPGLKELADDAGGITSVLILGNDADVDPASLAPIGKISNVVLLASNEGPLSAYATVILPVASFAECDGTFVNAKGLAQAFKRALAPRGDGVSAWDAVARIGRGMKLDLAYKKFSEVRAALAGKDVKPTLGRLDESTDPATHRPRAGV
ncbi:MAG: 2Fe-2S iron-sulfur cluster-binding protein [Deltaproteobacteria bacterium]